MLQILVLGHYVFLKDHSFPRATLSENCSLLGTDNVCELICQHIFVPKGGYSLYISQMTENSKTKGGRGFFELEF